MSNAEIKSQVSEILAAARGEGLLVDVILASFDSSTVRQAIAVIDAMWAAGEILVTGAPGSTVGEGAATIYPTD